MGSDGDLKEILVVSTRVMLHVRVLTLGTRTIRKHRLLQGMRFASASNEHLCPEINLSEMYPETATEFSYNKPRMQESAKVTVSTHYSSKAALKSSAMHLIKSLRGISKVKSHYKVKGLHLTFFSWHKEGRYC